MQNIIRLILAKIILLFYGHGRKHVYILLLKLRNLRMLLNVAREDWLTTL